MRSEFKYMLLIIFIAQVVMMAQSVTGKLVDAGGNPLSGLQMNLFIYPANYITISGADGDFTFNNITLGIDEKEQLPLGYSVSNNYPNPFNPKTRISISLPKNSNIRIDVYNMLGQRVIDEINKAFGEGVSYIDLELNGLPNGIYLAHFLIDDRYTLTKKLVLMYGSQHLNPGIEKPIIQMNKSTFINPSFGSTKLDSLIITGATIKKNLITGLPLLAGNSLDLGNIYINTTLTGIPCIGTPTVNYAGKVYNTVFIGNQCWLKENLDVGDFLNSNKEPTNNGKIEKYCYNNSLSLCAIYGGFYKWDEAMAYSTDPGSRGLCPPDFQIPTLAELEILAAKVNNTGNQLKAIGQGVGAGAGTDETGFSALLGGTIWSDNFSRGLASWTTFWSSSKDEPTVTTLNLYRSNENIVFYPDRKNFAFNIRCIKN